MCNSWLTEAAVHLSEAQRNPWKSARLDNMNLSYVVACGLLVTLLSERMEAKPLTQAQQKVSHLYPGQKQCVAWMLEAESGWTAGLWCMRSGLLFYASCFIILVGSNHSAKILFSTLELISPHKLPFSIINILFVFLRGKKTLSCNWQSLYSPTLFVIFNIHGSWNEWGEIK